MCMEKWPFYKNPSRFIFVHISDCTLIALDFKHIDMDFNVADEHAIAFLGK